MLRIFLYDLEESQTGFPQLKHPKWFGTEAHVEAPNLDAFPVLESLMYLHNLINLEKICNAQLGKQAFAKLKVVKVGSCYSLKNLFSFLIPGGLLQLQEMEAVDCENMVEIVEEGRERGGSENEAMTRIEFRKLQLLTLQQLPMLFSFNTGNTTIALFLYIFQTLAF